MATLVQFLLACAFGSAGFIWLYPEPGNPNVPYVGGAILGFAGQWACMFCYVWARYGWRAARSISFG